MKTQPHRSRGVLLNAVSTPSNYRAIRQRGPSSLSPRPPPTAVARRYPSLSDDGQPWFPPYVVRVFALLALIAIFAALAVTSH